MSYIEESQREMEVAVEYFKHELTAIRTGRANAALVENVTVDAYGVQTPLSHIAAITIPDAKTLAIQPWDRGLIKSVEKAIIEMNLNIMPVVDSDTVRLKLPALTEESRRALIKAVNHKAEESRVSVRKIRDKVRNTIAADQKAGNLSEDDKFKLFKKIDELTNKMADSILELVKAKEAEVMAV